MGRLSVAVSILALLYLAFATTLCMFPTQGLKPNRKSTFQLPSSFVVRHGSHDLNRSSFSQSQQKKSTSIFHGKMLT